MVDRGEPLFAEVVVEEADDEGGGGGEPTRWALLPLLPLDEQRSSSSFDDGLGGEASSGPTETLVVLLLPTISSAR